MSESSGRSGTPPNADVRHWLSSSENGEGIALALVVALAAVVLVLQMAGVLFSLALFGSASGVTPLTLMRYVIAFIDEPRVIGVALRLTLASTVVVGGGALALFRGRTRPLHGEAPDMKR